MKGQKSALYLTPRSQCVIRLGRLASIHAVAVRIQSTVWTDKLSTLKKILPRAKIVSDRNVKRLVFVLLEIAPLLRPEYTAPVLIWSKDVS